MSELDMTPAWRRDDGELVGDWGWAQLNEFSCGRLRDYLATGIRQPTVWYLDGGVEFAVLF